MDTTSTQSASPSEANPDTTPPKLAIVLEGGLVQAVVSDRPGKICAEVLVIDYDTEGAADDELSEVPQGDCSLSDAFVSGRAIEVAAIDLDHIVDKTGADL